MWQIDCHLESISLKGINLTTNFLYVFSRELEKGVWNISSPLFHFKPECIILLRKELFYCWTVSVSNFFGSIKSPLKFVCLPASFGRICAKVIQKHFFFFFNLDLDYDNETELFATCVRIIQKHFFPFVI